jgi:hypothetical protein
MRQSAELVIKINHNKVLTSKASTYIRNKQAENHNLKSLVEMKK